MGIMGMRVLALAWDFKGIFLCAFYAYQIYDPLDWKI